MAPSDFIFIILIAYVVAFVMGIVLGMGISRGKEKRNVEKKDAETFPETRSASKKQTPKERRKNDIIAFVEKHDRITNNDIETLFNVSDATATRYLQELENDGMLEQVGDTGRSVFYRFK